MNWIGVILGCFAMMGVGGFFGWVAWEADQEVQWERFGEEEALIIWIRREGQ